MAADYDLLTFGETMIRLATLDRARLEDAQRLELRVGGTESNLAVALARLGRPVAWCSALPDNPLGRRIARELRGHGVDVSHVLWTAQGRAGVYFLDVGSAPRPTRVIYDRAASAVAMLDPRLMNYELVGRARLLHLTGITPALSASCAEICVQLADAAVAAGVPLSLDVNYRTLLWTPEAAQAGLAPLLERATLLLCGASDAGSIWGLRGEAQQLAAHLLDISSAETVVVTAGAEGATALTRTGRAVSVPAPAVDIVDPVGAGDAFAAGFLHCWLNSDDLESGLRAGTVMAALKMTMPGDLALVTAGELAEALALLDQPGAEIVR
jgi:2-dehydro-3-deoxygluconokinase